MNVTTTDVAGLLQNRITLPAASALDTVAIAANPAISPDSTRVNFADVFKGALETVSAQQQSASQMQEKVEMGLTSDLVGTMIATEKASLSFQAVVQVRNRVVSAYETVFNMPV